MDVQLLEMRKYGVEIPRRSLFDRYNRAISGKLMVTDTTDQGLHRLVKVAKFSSGPPNTNNLTLFDPHLVWVNEGRFVLTGFERCKDGQGQSVDYAQSWLCLVGIAQPPMPEERR